jgi:ribosomal protein S6
LLKNTACGSLYPMVKDETQIEKKEQKNQAVTDESQVYELGFHIIPTVPEENLAGEVSGIKDPIEKLKGSFISEEFPRNIALAYTMDKTIAGKKQRFNNAYFGWVKFRLDPGHLKEIKESADANENILRYILIKTVAEDTMTHIRYTPVSPKDEEITDREEKPKEKEIPAEDTEESRQKLDKTIDDLVIS